jgi:hypothetical protein
MTVTSITSPTWGDPGEAYPQDVETPECSEHENGSEASPYSPSRGRRALVVVMGMMMAGVALAVIGMAWMRGSWWYSYGTDEPLDRAARARVEAIRDALEAGGAAPDAATWLNAALDPQIDPSTTRYYLIAAQESLQATGDAKLIEMAEELRVIVQMIYHPPAKHTATPYPEATLEWPW